MQLQQYIFIALGLWLGIASTTAHAQCDAAGTLFAGIAIGTMVQPFYWDAPPYFYGPYPYDDYPYSRAWYPYMPRRWQRGYPQWMPQTYRRGRR